MLRIQRMRSIGTRVRSVGVSGFNSSVPVPPTGAAFAVAVHPSLCRSDASNTVPSTVGGKIRWWYDLISRSWFQQSTGSSQFTMQQDATSKKYYAVYSTATSHQFGWVVDPSVNGSNYTIGCGLTGVATTNVGIIYDAGNGTNSYAIGCSEFVSGTPSTNYEVVVSGVQASGFGTIAAASRIIMESQSTASLAWDVNVNGTQVFALSGRPIPAANSTAISIGGSTGFAGKSLTTGNIYGICGYTSVSAGTLAIVDNWLRSIMP